MYIDVLIQFKYSLHIFIDNPSRPFNLSSMKILAFFYGRDIKNDDIK